MQLKGGAVGQIERIDYHTESSVKTTGRDKISRNKIEAMNFTAEVQTLSIDQKDGHFEQEVVVTKKDGDIDLHDMAFPELNEKLHMGYSPRGEVLKAGSFPRESIFYVPPISLPLKQVSVGDTWVMNAEWYSRKNGVKMSLNLLTIFKRTVPCGRWLCADLELSGSVKIPGIGVDILRLNSELVGRILFAIEPGSILWSEIRNIEDISVNEVKVYVQSCLESVARAPEVWAAQKMKPDCQVPFESEVAVPL